MDIKRFGNRQGKTIMLLHGNLMCWRQFENLIPLLEKKFRVYAVSFDGKERPLCCCTEILCAGGSLRI